MGIMYFQIIVLRTATKYELPRRNRALWVLGRHQHPQLSENEKIQQLTRACSIRHAACVVRAVTVRLAN